MKLTARQRQVYNFIVDSIRSGRPPTFREIARHIGARGPNGAKYHVDVLVKKGYITVSAGSRGIRLANQDTCPLCGSCKPIA